MAAGLDELLDFLLSEIALLGVQGMHDSLNALSPLKLHQPRAITFDGLLYPCFAVLVSKTCHLLNSSVFIILPLRILVASISGRF